MGRDADHIFSVPFWFFFSVWVDWLVDTLLEMVKNSVSCGLPNRSIEEGGMWSVEVHLGPIWEIEVYDTARDSDLDVQHEGRAMEAESGALR